MSEQTERDLATSEPDQSATDTPVSKTPGAPISLDDATVKALVDHPEFQSALQGVKDRRFARIEKGLDGVEAVIEQLNLTDEQRQAYNQINQQDKLNRLFEAVFGDNQEPDQPKAVSGQAATPDARKPLDIGSAYKAAGFDPNSLTLDDITFAESFTDPVALNNALLKKAAEARASSPPASPASSPPVQSGVSVSQHSEAALLKEYNSKLAKLPRGNIDAITDLKKEYRKKGLDIY